MVTGVFVFKRIGEFDGILCRFGIKVLQINSSGHQVQFQ